MNYSLMMICFIISVLGGIGLSIAFVEKRKEWPIRYFSINLRKFLSKFSNKAHRVGKCSVCFSFWATGFIDIIINIIMYCKFNENMWLWPITGFVSLGLLWMFYEILNTLNSMSESILYSRQE